MTHPKPKKCRACGDKFTPFNSMQVVCPGSVKCALQLVEEQKEKENRKAANKARKALRELDRSYWLKAAQREFNKWVRLRDRDLPCISCGKPAHEEHNGITGSAWDCGHYRSTGACPELRFEPLNAHRQCVKCNRNLSGNVVEYRIRLLDRIGAEKLEWLEGPHEAKKYTIEDLRQIRDKYRGLINHIAKGAR